MADHFVLHIEIPTTNPAAAGTFYHDVFGWKTDINTEHNYATFESEQGYRGGFTGPSEPSYKPDRLLVYLLADDIDATLATIETHGGKTVVPKTEIPHVGQWAIFTDPAGNHLGLFLRYPSSS